MDFFDLMDELNEAAVGDLLRKQKSITKLFPKFYDRVKAVAGRGGIRPVSQGKNEWVFKVHSGTKDGVWYDVTVRFLNILALLNAYADEKDMWREDESGLDRGKLARQIYLNVKLQTRCSCPADLYWGKQYIRSRPGLDANVPPPEDRPPVVRNPHEYGAFCKHTQLMVNLLPLYRGSFAKFLEKYWGKELMELEKTARKRDAGVLPPTVPKARQVKRRTRPEVKQGARPPAPPVAPRAPREPRAPRGPAAPVAPRRPLPPEEGL